MMIPTRPGVASDMPYASDKQRKFMHAKHPEIAKRWDAEAKAKAQPKPKPAKKVRGK